MYRMTLSTRFLLTILAAVLVAFAGSWIWIHDTPLLLALVLTAGLIWSRRPKAAAAVAVVLVALGSYWSSLDITGCSVWWKGGIAYSKAKGDLPYMGWNDVARSVFSRCYGLAWPHPDVAERVNQVETKVLNGRECELYRTDLGDFWIPAPGNSQLSFLIWEMTVQRVYENGAVRIRPGDTVVDCGAHVGVFTRYALSRGVAKVVAIEPEPTNIACLKANLAPEIASGKVVLIKAGVWDEKTNLPLTVSPGHSGSHRFDDHAGDRHSDGIPVLPLDEMVEQLGLERVDFIKMDIEGAEARALRGAMQIVRRFKPNMAICTYHGEQDPRMVPQAVHSISEDYLVQGRDVENQWYMVRPKVLFFDASPVHALTASSATLD